MCVPICFQLAWHIPISFPVLLSYTMSSFIFTSSNGSMCGSSSICKDIVHLIYHFLTPSCCLTSKLVMSVCIFDGSVKPLAPAFSYDPVVSELDEARTVVASQRLPGGARPMFWSLPGWWSGDLHHDRYGSPIVLMDALELTPMVFLHPLPSACTTSNVVSGLIVVELQYDLLIHAPGVLLQLRIYVRSFPSSS